MEKKSFVSNYSADLILCFDNSGGDYY